MATLVERVQELADTGYTSVTQEDLVVDYLRAGLLSLIRLIPPQVQWQYASEIVDENGTTGASLDGPVLLGAASTAGRVATQWPVARKAELSNSGSLYAASAFSPRFYVEANRVYVKPSGGKVYVITAPQITPSTSNVDNLPEQFAEIAVLYAAMRVLINKLQDVGTGLTVSPITAGTLDAIASLVDPYYTINNISAGTITDPGNVASTPSASIGDDRTGASANPTTTPNVSDRNSVTIESAGTVNFPVAPTPPTIELMHDDVALWDFDWTGSGEALEVAALPADIVLPTLNIGYPTIPSANTTATLTGSAPNPADFDFTVGTVTGSAITLVSIPELPAPPAYTEVSVDNIWGDDTVTEFPTLLSANDILTWIHERQNEHDSEMSNSLVAFIGQVLDKYQKDLFNKINVFNANNADFQREVDRILKQAELDLNVSIKQAELDYGVSKDNAYEQARINAQVYAEQARGFAAEVEAYRAQINAEVQVFVAEHIQGHLQAWLKEADAAIAAYQGEIAALQADQQKDLTIFQAKVQKDTERVRLALQDIIQGNQNNIALFNAQLSKYQAELSVLFQELQLEQSRMVTQAELDIRVALANLEKDVAKAVKDAEVSTQAAIASASNLTQVDIAELQATVQANIAVMQAKSQESISQVQVDLQQYIRQAELDLQAAQSNQQADVQIKVALIQAELQARLTEFQSDIQGQIATINAQVQADIAELQAEVQLKAQLIQEIQTRYQWLQGLYVTEIQNWLGQFGGQA